MIGDKTEIKCDDCGEFKREVLGEIKCFNDKCPSTKRLKKRLGEFMESWREK